MAFDKAKHVHRGSSPWKFCSFVPFLPDSFSPDHLGQGNHQGSGHDFWHQIFSAFQVKRSQLTALSGLLCPGGYARGRGQCPGVLAVTRRACCHQACFLCRGMLAVCGGAINIWLTTSYCVHQICIHLGKKLRYSLITLTFIANTWQHCFERQSVGLIRSIAIRDKICI